MRARRSSLAGLNSVARSPRPAVPLDELDLHLLELLAADSRMSQRQLAAQLGVSAPTVSDRMARLERTGVIRGYSVTVDWEALGYGIAVFVSVSAVPDSDLGEVMRSLWTIAEVEEVSAVTGSLDLIVRVRVRDQRHLRSLLMNDLWQVPGLQGTETMLAVAEMPVKPFLKNLLIDMRENARDERGERA